MGGSLSERREELEICKFPKHDGEEWEDVMEEDRSYVEFLVSGESRAPDMSTALYDRLMDLLEEL